MRVFEKDTVNIMIDLETLSTKSNALILSIGACVMLCDNTIGAEFYERVCPLDNIGNIDIKTILWWMKQGKEAREELFNDDIEKAPFIGEVLTDFSDWVSEQCDNKDNLRVWANGINFDTVIVRNACDALGMETPWLYNTERDYRTVMSMVPDIEKVRSRIAHHALEDAKAQAIRLMNAADHLS